MAAPTAISGTKGNAVYAARGMTDVAMTYEERRKYYDDNEIVFIQRAYSPLFTLLWNKMSRISTNDYQPRWYRDVDDEGVYTPNSDISATYGYFYVDFGTTNIRRVIPGMQFTINGIFFRKSATLAAGDWVLNRGDTNNDGNVVGNFEVIEVVSVDVTNGIAFVKRGDGTQTATCTQAITTSMRLVRKETSLAMGQDEPTALSLDIDYDTNNVETMSKTYEMARQQLNSTFFTGTGEEEFNRRMARAERDLMIEAERTLLHGFKTSGYDTAGRWKLTMGGLIEFIVANSKSTRLDNISRMINLNGNALDLQGTYANGGVMDLCTLLFRYGNPMSEKYAFCGEQVLNEWTLMFKNNVRMNDELSGKINLNVTSIATNAGTLNFMHWPAMTIGNLDSGTASQNTSMDMAVIDDTLVDLIVNQAPAHKPVDINNHAVKGEVFMDISIKYMKAVAHFYIHNIGRAT